jgi:hypothetical protein
MDPMDLVVFGPHPDHIEIGIGGTVAKHAALGHRVGLWDLTAGEMGSNGTVEERLAEAEQARAVPGATWRVNLRWPDRAFGKNPDHVRADAPRVQRGLTARTKFPPDSGAIRSAALPVTPRAKSSRIWPARLSRDRGEFATLIGAANLSTWGGPWRQSLHLQSKEPLLSGGTPGEVIECSRNTICGLHSSSV